MAERINFEHGHYNFELDLKDSYAVEHEFGDLIAKRKDVKEVTYNDSYHYDVKVVLKNGTEWRFEIKNDKMSEQTGNVGLEFESRGKPSLFARYDKPATDGRKLADIWIFRLSGEYWQIHQAKLRRLVKEEKFFTIKDNVGDNGTSKMYLFKKSELLPHMKKYED